MHNERPDILQKYPDGTVRIREVLTIIFYLPVPNLKIVEYVDHAIRKFVNLVSFEGLREYYNYEGKQENLNPLSLDEIIYNRLYSEERAPNANIELIGSGANAPEYFLWYNGKALNITQFPDEVGYLWCWVPRSFFLDHTDELLNYISSVESELPYSFAYASLALAGENELGKQALAARHTGLDIANPFCVSADLNQKVAGSYWLSLLGAELCRLVGGVAAVRAELPDEIIVEELPDSRCRILLSEQPEIGDTNRRDLLPANQALARFFAERGRLHVPERVVYFEDREGMADREAMERWHRRFVD